jgi:hypothetical protein
MEPPLTASCLDQDVDGDSGEHHQPSGERADAGRFVEREPNPKPTTAVCRFLSVSGKPLELSRPFPRAMHNAENGDNVVRCLIWNYEWRAADD